MQRKYAVMILVIQACNSGAAINHLYGDRRIIITAARYDEYSYTETGGYEHWAFLYEGKIMNTGFTVSTYSGFIKGLGVMHSPLSLYNAYAYGYVAATNNYAMELGVIIDDYRSHPQIYNIDFAKEVYL